MPRLRSSKVQCYKILTANTDWKIKLMGPFYATVLHGQYRWCMSMAGANLSAVVVDFLLITRFEPWDLPSQDSGEAYPPG